MNVIQALQAALLTEDPVVGVPLNGEPLKRVRDRVRAQASRAGCHISTHVSDDHTELVVWVKHGWDPF